MSCPYCFGPFDAAMNCINPDCPKAFTGKIPSRPKKEYLLCKGENSDALSSKVNMAMNNLQYVPLGAPFFCPEEKVYIQALVRNLFVEEDRLVIDPETGLSHKVDTND